MNSRSVTVVLALGLLVGLGVVLALVLSGGEQVAKPGQQRAEGSETAPTRVPRKRRAKYPELDTLWGSALEEFAAGRAAEALALLHDARTSGHPYFDDAGRRSILARMEEKALAELEREVTARNARAARELAGRLSGLLTEAEAKARVATLLAELARLEAERRGLDMARLAGATQDERDREQLERHLARFGAGPAKPGDEQRTADWVDPVLERVRRRRRVAPAGPPFPVADEDAAAKRRAEQLEKLRQRDAVGLLDHIHAGLAWLALHQADDGRIGDDVIASRCKALGHGKTRCPGRNGRYTVAATALSVLAFLDFRDQDAAGLFEPSLTRGVNWLLSQQKSDGSFPRVRGYTPGIVLMALGQAAGSSGREDLRAAVRRGFEHYASVAGPAGGFRYAPRQGGDLSVTGWYVQAYEAARDAGLEAPPAFAEGLERFVRATAHGTTGFSYLPGFESRPSLQSVGMLSSLILRDDLDETQLAAWRQALAKRPPERRDGKSVKKPRRLRQSLYTLYYDVRVQLALDAGLTPGRRQDVFVLAEDYQVRDGPGAGMFDAKGAGHMASSGTAVVTAFSVLTLEHALYRR